MWFFERSIRSYILIIFSSSFLITLFGTGFFFGRRYEQSHTPHVVTMPTMAPREITPEPVETTLLNLVQSQTPREALQKLQELMKNDYKVLRNCHSLAHDIGHAAIRKYKSFDAAIVYQDDVCGSGYMHGVIEAYFVSDTHAIEEMQTVCDPNDGRCFHAVGHGLMYYTLNNLPKSLEYCKKFNSSFALTNCADGVFMENFATNQADHPSQFVKESDPLYPCSEQEQQFQSSCYFYAPRFYVKLYFDDYSGALKLCQKADPAYQQTCAKGVGSVTMKQNLYDPLFVERTCMSNAADQVASCIQGMMSYFTVDSNSVEKANQVCSTLLPMNKKTCYDYVSTSANVKGIMIHR